MPEGISMIGSFERLWAKIVSDFENTIPFLKLSLSLKEEKSSESR